MSTRGEQDGTYEAGVVAAAARQRDPGLPEDTAALLAERALALLQEQPQLDAPALARALMAGAPDLGATPCTVVASAAVSRLAPDGG